MLKNTLSSISNCSVHGGAMIGIWDKLQRHQTDFCIAQEFQIFYMSKQWDKAQTVLDLGTGNGYYLRKIAACFPDKQYYGIDISPELIQIAMKETTIKNISYSCCDPFDVDGLYDFVIMRLFLQHQTEVDAVLDKIATRTRKGGSVLVIDAADDGRLYYPDIPKFMRFFRAYIEHQEQRGLSRTVKSRLNSWVKKYPDWEIGNSFEIVIPSTIPGNMDLFRKTYGLFIDLVEKVGDMQYDFNAVRKEWEWWCSLEHGYTQAGLNIIRIDHI